eukprot:g14112.t1
MKRKEFAYAACVLLMTLLQPFAPLLAAPKSCFSFSFSSFLHGISDGVWRGQRRSSGVVPFRFPLQGTNKSVRSIPDLITKDPSAVKNCDVVFFTVPSSFHEQYFTKLEPYVQAGTIFAVMPARSGCDFLFKKVMGEKAETLGLVAFETLPWACRFNDWGKTATVLGTKDEKETIGAAVVPPVKQSKMDVILKLQGLLGVEPKINEVPNIMSISLGNPGQVIHPGVTYGRWHAWDGKPLAKKPLFYQGVDNETADVLTGISDDIQKICAALKKLDGQYNTSQVQTVMEWYMSSFHVLANHFFSFRCPMHTCVRFVEAHDQVALFPQWRVSLREASLQNRHIGRYCCS